MSLYPDYLKEREGLSVFETPSGFATYKLRGSDCYIQDIYVIPEKRKSGEALKIAEEVVAFAKRQGYNFLTGSVDARANGAEDSVKILSGYGMRPYSKEGHVTYFVKEI